MSIIRRFAMHHLAVRRLTAAAFAMTVFALAPAPASAAGGTLHLDELRVASQPSRSLGVAPDPCSDPAYRLLGGRQSNGHYSWSFDAGSTPGSLSRRHVRNVLRRAFSNVVNEHNDCGRATTIDATATYLGKTTRAPNCSRPDGRNVIGFGRLPSGVLAVTCFWVSGGRIVEADMIINSRESWALSLTGCHNQIMLEATVTHEAGHVFGLDHVGEKRHGRLTMSPYIDGVCENQEATLGLGDMLGLEALY
jgi:hypothetical protein